jgi:uncharacterized protein YbjT (DUF2867 family)/tryptophan-rich sensory protein
MNSSRPRIAFVTGSTGYIGGTLVEELASKGWGVKALTRSASKAEQQPWAWRIVPDSASADADGLSPEGQPAGAGKPLAAGDVQVVEAGLTDSAALTEALQGVDAAWFLVHSMAGGSDFRDEDREMAQAFATAAAAAGVGRIVYLGGLHPDGVQREELSSHLASRVEVGEILMASGVPTAALQAGVVVGHGSDSFTMMRHLSERLPGAVGPRWMANRITPISIRDALFYLRSAADLPAEQNRTFDIGSPDTMPYRDMLAIYADTCLSVPRITATAPILNQWVAARGISLMTPVPLTLAEPLIGSLVHETVVKEHDLPDLVGTPPGGPQSLVEAIRDATQPLDTGRWMRTVRRVGGAVALCAVAGSLFTQPKSRWYQSLAQPSWQPPAAAFPIVWTALYADIALMSALVIADAQENDDDAAARAYARRLGLNLVLNAAWPALFFRAKKPWLAAAEAGLLALSSADLVRLAARSSPERGLALSPYAAWTAFAAALNVAVARRNG